MYIFLKKAENLILLFESLEFIFQDPGSIQPLNKNK